MDKSVWSDYKKDFSFPALEKDINCQALVIGGGMAGVLTAYYLQNKGVDVVLVEGKSIGDGVTKNTTGVVTAQHDVFYSTLKKIHSEKRARLFLQANLWAVDEFENLDKAFPCDYVRTSSYMFSTTKSLEKEVAVLAKLGFEAKHKTSIDLPVTIKSAVEFPSMAQIHPLKLLYSVAKRLKIYEKTFVYKVKNNVAFTKGGKITAQHIIMATHFPFINTSGFYFTKLFQMRSYVAAYQGAKILEGTFVDTADKGLYFRQYKDLLLIGGSDHRTGTKGGGHAKIRNFAQKHFPNAVEKFAWSTQDCISLDGLPYIGKYSKSRKNIYVATGFNEWGMTGSVLAADIISDLVIGKTNKFAAAFNPKRNALRKQLFINLLVTLGNFLLPSVKRCPHLGCTLWYNKNQRSWDCACHGSRFDKDGKLIDNPAMKDAKV